MARGFESKDVEFQQAEAERPKRDKGSVTVAERDAHARRGTIELALLKARADLRSARTAAHREMLEHAIRSLEQQLQQTIMK
jgi:hypothetical protein